MELFYIWLECIKGLGPSGWHAVLDEFNNPYDVYINKKELVPQGRITPNHVKLIKENAEDALERAKAIVENCKRHNISIIKYVYKLPVIVDVVFAVGFITLTIEKPISISISWPEKLRI